MIYAIALQTEYDDQLTRLRTKSKLGPLLPAITAETGGGYFELTHTADLAAIVRRVAEERHHQYLIGFEAPVLDGETHPITVATYRVMEAHQLVEEHVDLVPVSSTREPCVPARPAHTTV